VQQEPHQQHDAGLEGIARFAGYGYGRVLIEPGVKYGTTSYQVQGLSTMHCLRAVVKTSTPSCCCGCCYSDVALSGVLALFVMPLLSKRQQRGKQLPSSGCDRGRGGMHSGTRQATTAEG
jgi:hypothetical protein